MYRISVVIPLYNKEKHIERCLSSIKAQTFKPCEVLVIDDGSTDKSAGIVEKIKDEHIVLIRKENGGASSARNLGMEKASGELIAFLDADDAWKPNFLETISRLRAGFPEAGAYATAYETFDGKSYIPVSYRNIPPVPWEGIIPNFFDSMLGQPPLWTSATVIRKDAFSNLGGFKVGEVIAEDVEFWCRIALKYPIAFSTSVNATYYLDADNRCYVRGKKHRRPGGYIETLEYALKDPGTKDEFIQPISVLREMVELGEATSYLFANLRKEAREVIKNYDWRSLKKQALMWYFLSFFPPEFSEWLMRAKKLISSR